jgi:hypothetical protein
MKGHEDEEKRGESMNIIWQKQRMVEERHKELLALAHRTRRSPKDAVLADMSVPATTMRPRLTAVEPDTHRALGHVVGEWLIRAGTRLSGTSIQTS